MAIQKFDIEGYTKTCLAFAKQSEDWLRLDNRFYTTSGFGEWRETCNNEHGGLDVSWAFHLSAEKIKTLSQEEFLDQLLQDLNQAVDEGFDSDQLQGLVNRYTDLRR